MSQLVFGRLLTNCSGSDPGSGEYYQDSDSVFGNLNRKWREVARVKSKEQTQRFLWWMDDAMMTLVLLSRWLLTSV